MAQAFLNTARVSAGSFHSVREDGGLRLLAGDGRARVSAAAFMFVRTFALPHFTSCHCDPAP
jgi:hypothetical protein